ncbi:MAG: hypothetical protein JHC98_00225 [Thermoleophilaceae bacterium]|nr:hypothetical protein [Thermoleophilaceae bacterium]
MSACFAVLAAACTVFAMAAASASAGTYSVYSCLGPNDEVVGNDAWVTQASVPGHANLFSLGTACNGFSVVASVGLAMVSGENAGVRFDAPAGTTILNYDIKRSAAVTFATSGSHPAISAGLRRTVASANTYWGECEAKKVDCAIAANGTQSSGINASSLQLGVECVEPSGCPSGATPSLWARLYNSQVELRDLNAPVVALTGGTLPGAVALAGKFSLAVAASDVGGGVRTVALSVDGVVKSASDSGGSCSTPYTKTVPCPSAVSKNYEFNLGDYGSGRHTVVVYATDAAGNVGALAPINFTIGGVGANGTPAVEVPALSTSKKLIAAKSAKKVAVRGVLRTSAGGAIGGATLEVYKSNLFGPSTLIPIGTTRTKADGKFSFKVKPSGALRITFVFRPADGAQSTASASTTLRQALTLSARGSQRVLRRGASLTIAGRLAGAASAAGGAPVEIEVRNGKRWSAIEVVTAGRSGAYKWQHRFTRVTRPTLFSFRAIVRAKQGWPWPSKASPVVQALVMP